MNKMKILARMREGGILGIIRVPLMGNFGTFEWPAREEIESLLVAVGPIQ